MSAKAHAGLLLAFVLFVGYWLLAGPLGFGLLKYYGQVRHAWIAFAGCAALFTAVAWGSVGLLPKMMEVKHITFLDHVARPPKELSRPEPQYQRATSYLSVYLPDYGSTELAIAPTDGDVHNVLSSWSSPGEAQAPFPNVDRYVINIARSPDRYSLPSRSTSTQLYAHWLGGLDRNWGSMLQVSPESPIQVVKLGETEDSLRGTIINELPGTLRDVTIIWVQNNRTPRRTYQQIDGREAKWVNASQSGMPLNSAKVWRLDASQPWASGKPLELGGLRSSSPLVNTITSRYIAPYRQNEGGLPSSNMRLSPNDVRNYIEMLCMFQQLTPPIYLKVNEVDGNVAFQRRLGRELDLSPWFSRPCLIIIGFLDGAQLPLPLRVDRDDEPPPSNKDSLVVVRWIYPLPLDEKIAFKDVFEQPEGMTDENPESSSTSDGAGSE